MSKSYKKHPYIVQEKYTKLDKKIHNHQLRQKKIDYAIFGGEYKKIISQTGNWKYLWTKKDAIESFKQNGSRFYSTLDEYINYWEKCCIRK